MRVNALGPGILARTCAKAGARMIHISTDYVFSGAFDGTPRPYDVEDATGPLSVYGKTKLAGEREVHAALPNGARGPHVVGVHRRRVRFRRHHAQAGGQETDPSAWLSTRSGRRPTSRTWSAALLQIAERPTAPPLLHVANEGAASRFEQARAVFEGVGADPERVRPVATEDVPRPAARPPYSALSGRAATAAGLAPLRPWRDALAAALADS